MTFIPIASTRRACPERGRRVRGNLGAEWRDCHTPSSRSQYLMSLRRAFRRGSGQAHGHESLPIPGPRPLTFILSPPVGERSSLLWFPSPLWGEGSGEGTFEAMTPDLMLLLTQRFKDGHLQVVGLPHMQQDRVILGLGAELDQSKPAMRVGGRLGQHLAEQLG